MKKGFTGQIALGKSLTRRWEKNKERDRIRRRKVVDGYPINEPFKSIKDVEHYLSGDKITCLLCGKQYKALGTHLSVHCYTPSTYREKYKIPNTFGLVSTETFNKFSAQAKKQHQDGIMPNAGEMIKHYYVYGGSRKPSTYKSVKELDNDKEKAKRVAKYREIRHKERLQKTHCSNGHPLKEIGNPYCNTCERERARKREGYLSREEALTTYVNVVCTFCGKETQSLRISSTRKVVQCKECRLRRNNENHKKRRTKEMRRLEYLKYKLKRNEQNA